MARTKGTANLSGTIEPLAGGALDARTIVPAKADLTASGTFPYAYIGMETYVVAENKKYRLIGSDPTVLANWQEIGAGGGASSLEDLSDVEITDVSDGDILKYDETEEKWVNGGVSGGGGHTIEDPEGTALTQRDTLQFGGDLEVSDDDENEKTVVAPHELTAAELAEIVTPLPSVPVNMPILFDETGTERVVGWYRLSNETKKPVYEKTVTGTVLSVNAWHEIISLGTTCVIQDIISAHIIYPDNNDMLLPSNNRQLAFNTVNILGGRKNGSIAYYTMDSNDNGKTVRATVQYTKNTDTPT